MKNNYFHRLQEASDLFKDEKLDEAAIAYSDIVTELLIENKEIELAEIAMQLAINAYGKIEHNPEEGLYSQYFAVVRDIDDNQELFDINVLHEPISPNFGSRNYLTFDSHDTYQSLSNVGPYQTYTVSAQGPRDTMEDTHLATEFKLKGGTIVQLFAVFDGHAGASCAIYAKNHLQKKIIDHLVHLALPSIANSLSKVCIELDADWKKEFEDRSGSTLSAALLINRELWVFNVGDSRIVLADGQQAYQLSEDAKPPIEKFENELIRRGSVVRNKRAGGTLDMARSIGDIEHPAVSARPTIRRFVLKERSYTLIIACDGLWDVVGTEDTVKHCSKHTDLEEMGNSLKDLAFSYGSADNVTIMLVNL